MVKKNSTFNVDNGQDTLLERYLNDISVYAPLSDEEESELSARSLLGDEKARETLVKSNLKFVVSIARQYASEAVSIVDLINEGNIALLRAAEKYDARIGKRFSAYAVWYVRQAMSFFSPAQNRLFKNADMDSQYFVDMSLDSISKDFADEKILLEALNTLPKREQYVLKGYFGVGQKQMTMREIGEKNNMSRARVKQIRKRALRRLNTLKKQFQ